MSLVIFCIFCVLSVSHSLIALLPLSHRAPLLSGSLTAALGDMFLHHQEHTLEFIQTQSHIQRSLFWPFHGKMLYKMKQSRFYTLNGYSGDLVSLLASSLQTYK